MSRLYSSFLKKLTLPIADYFMKTKIIYYYDRIKIMESWDSKKVENWQNEKLHKIVNNAYNNTKYYRELFDNLGLDPNEIRTKYDLHKIPILTKDIVNKNYNRLISKQINCIPHKASSTGGSTGNPMRYLLDKKSWSFINAFNIINWEKTGYNFGDKYIALGSTSLFVNNSISIKHKLYYRLKNKVGLNGINMSDEVCEKYIKLINRNQIKYIYGYASAIYLLAKYVSNNNIVTNILVCFTTSEILTDLYRKTIKEAFKCKVINCYGAYDGGITTFEHIRGNFNVGYNTIVRLKNTKNGSINKSSILLTDIMNYSMPLINYELGDEVKMKEENAEYNGQVIENVYGRTSDLMKLENGNILTGPGFTIIFKDLPVEAYSVSKIGKNSLLCKIQTLDDFNKNHENIIVSTIKKNAGTETKIQFEYVEKFELLSSGKRNYFFTQ